MRTLTRLLDTTRGLPDRPLRVLLIATHERVESGFARTGHDFYVLQGDGLKTWDSTYAPPPANFTFLPPNRVPHDLTFDVVLCQNRPAHFASLKRLAARWRVPLLCLEHILPQPSWPADLRAWLSSSRGDVNAFVSEYGRREWGYGEDPDAVVVENGIDTELFRPVLDYERANVCLSIVNDWIRRDAECGYKFWVEATRGLPTRVLGKTPGLSEPARSLDHLAYAYQTSSIFLNTARVSPIPTVLLEAMSSGCCVISTRNPMLESIIKDGVNGFFRDTPAEMRGLALEMLGRPVEVREIGARARKTVEWRFGLERHIAAWDGLLKRAAGMTLEG